MKYSFLFVLMLVGWLSSNAQESSDPEAMEILEQIKEDFDKNGDHQIEFDLTVEYPGEANQVYSGRLLQSGEKFSLDLGDKLVISDNETVWLYLKERNELQINDADFGDDGEYMSPNRIFNLYMSKDYVFALSNNSYEDSKAVSHIECKPLDSDSEYSKMRLTVEDKGNRVKRFKIFSKDGSRFTMVLKEHKKNVKLAAKSFAFDASEYQDIIVEDLRF